jgi:hypothetical protein
MQSPPPKKQALIQCLGGGIQALAQIRSMQPSVEQCGMTGPCWNYRSGHDRHYLASRTPRWRWWGWEHGNKRASHFYVRLLGGQAPTLQPASSSRGAIATAQAGSRSPNSEHVPLARETDGLRRSFSSRTRWNLIGSRPTASQRPPPASPGWRTIRVLIAKRPRWPKSALSTVNWHLFPGQHLGTIGTFCVMIARCRHQSQAPHISTVTASQIKLPGTVGLPAPCHPTGWPSCIGRREISWAPCCGILRF